MQLVLFTFILFCTHSPTHPRIYTHVITQVGEPTVEATISILRGLKPRYEAHHGVRISDRALVAAAVLSGRYIRGRFLPDKAIDLVDEAAARTRVQLDSTPEVIDVLERRKLQLEIESAALSKEKVRTHVHSVVVIVSGFGRLTSLACFHCSCDECSAIHVEHYIFSP